MNREDLSDGGLHLGSPNEPFLEIAKERYRQDMKWGPPSDLPKDRTPEHWLAILMEEVGELAEAVVETAAGGQGWDIRGELIQTAAVAVSWLEWLAVNEPESRRE